MTRSRYLAWTTLALAVVLGPVVRGQDGGRAPTPDPLGAHRLTGRPGEVVPRFTLRDLDGNEHTLEQQLRRGRMTVLEWIAPTADEWRALHGPGGALRETRLERRDEVAWLAICTFAVEDPGERTSAQDPPVVAPGRSGQQVKQQTAFWGRDDGQRPSWDRERAGPATATWPWFEQPPAARFEGLTARLRPESALPLCRQASQLLGPDVPVLLDAGGSVAGRLGVTRAPHVVVVDRDGRLAYSGPPLTPEGTNPVEQVLAELARAAAPTKTEEPR